MTEYGRLTAHCTGVSNVASTCLTLRQHMATVSARQKMPHSAKQRHALVCDFSKRRQGGDLSSPRQRVCHVTVRPDSGSASNTGQRGRSNSRDRIGEAQVRSSLGVLAHQITPLVSPQSLYLLAGFARQVHGVCHAPQEGSNTMFPDPLKCCSALPRYPCGAVLTFNPLGGLVILFAWRGPTPHAAGVCRLRSATRQMHDVNTVSYQQGDRH